MYKVKKPTICGGDYHQTCFYTGNQYFLFLERDLRVELDLKPFTFHVLIVGRFLLGQSSLQACPLSNDPNKVGTEFMLTKKQITAAINNPNPEFTMKRALIMKEYMPKDVEPLPNDWIEVRHKSHMNLYWIVFEKFLNKMNKNLAD